jgi:hypothetical protein
MRKFKSFSSNQLPTFSIVESSSSKRDDTVEPINFQNLTEEMVANKKKCSEWLREAKE